MNGHSDKRWFLFLVATVVVALSTSAGALELTVKNDSITGTGDATPCLCFISGEIAASWLSIPTDGTLVGVQVFWQSQFGGNPDSLEMAVHIYNGGTFPTPGALLASVIGPTLSDGVFNEFRYTDPPSNTIPINLLVTQGQTIVVGVEMINQSSGDAFASSTSYDHDGCQANKNVVFTIPGGWGNVCLMGVTGDWAIRAIVVPYNNVPTLSQWGMIIFMTLMMGIGVMILRKRSMA